MAKPIAYVATMNDSVYAIDGTSCQVLGQFALFPTGSGEFAAKTVDLGQGGNLFGPKVGVLGTPVIALNPGSNPSTGTLYVVAESESGSPPNTTFYHRLWALDITSLQPVSAYGGYVTICASGCGTVPFSLNHIQRPGLLCLGANSATCPGSLANTVVYVAFSMMDGAPLNPNGWIFGFNAQSLGTAPLYNYETTPEIGGRRGGIWQGAAGLAAGVDSSGGNTYIYFSTGDGDFDLKSDGTGGTNAADSLVKLTTSLAIPGGSYTSANFFAPSDQCYRQSSDNDFGSAGVMLLPDNLLSGNPFVAIKSDKEDYLWVVNRGAPGGYDQGNADKCPAPNPGYTCADEGQVPSCPTSDWQNGNIESLAINPVGANAHTAPAFWAGNTAGTQKGWVYFAALGQALQAYPIDPNCSTPPLCPATHQTAATLGYSATPAVSSGPSPTYSNGVVWAIKSLTGAVGLYAFDAKNLSELYDTTHCIIGGVSQDAPGNPTRFSVPTIANGRVYIGTETDFDIYGQLQQTRNCPPVP